MKNFYETDNKDNLEDDIKTYVENIQKDGEYSGDMEINITASLLNINILCYTLINSEYKLQAVYFGNNNKNVLIPLNYINNNHFEILYPLEYIISNKSITFKKNPLKKDFKDIINIDKSFTIFFTGKYLDYSRSYKEKYNDIFYYLKTGNTPKAFENINNTKKR